MEEQKKKNTINKKTDLLKFQKTLNEQFLEIFSQKNIDYDENNTELLGLTSVFRESNMFISLKDLKSIATKLKYENSIRTKSWVFGFNQDHGNIYTIFNMPKVFDLIIDNKTDFELPSLSINSNILYLNNYSEDYFGFLLNEFKLDYTADFTLFFSRKENEESFKWELADGIDFELFFKKDGMSEADWELVNIIYQASQKKQNIKKGVFPNYEPNNKYYLLSLMISKVYLESYGKKPIFMLDLENITRYLKNISPF